MREAVRLSDDQKKVVNQLGWPATFFLIDGAYQDDGEDARIERWYYPAHKKAFIFKDREFRATEDVKSKEKVIANPLRPTAFSRDLGSKDLVAALGEPQSKRLTKEDLAATSGQSIEKAQAVCDELGKIESFYFPEAEVVVVFRNNKLWSVQTISMEESK